VILCGILLLACFLLVPETLYARELPAHPTDSSLDKGVKAEDEASSVKIEDITQRCSTSTGQYKELTFLRSLKLHTYHGNLMQNFIAPWLTLRLPGVWLVMFWYAGLVGGVVTITTVGPTLVAQPPYLWGANAGLLMIGGIVGAILGAVVTALSADRIITTKKTLEGDENMEPETRLPVALPGLILATTGLWTFGFCAQSPNPHMWIGMQFGLGMLSFGLMQAPSIGFNYVKIPLPLFKSPKLPQPQISWLTISDKQIIDAYGCISADCFVAVTCMRAIISFAWTFFASDWVSSAGPAIPFGVFGGLMGIFTLLTIPQWLSGKRTRIATAKWIPQ
jgi:hypothetical protein